MKVIDSIMKVIDSIMKVIDSIMKAIDSIMKVRAFRMKVRANRMKMGANRMNYKFILNMLPSKMNMRDCMNLEFFYKWPSIGGRLHSNLRPGK